MYILEAELVLRDNVDFVLGIIMLLPEVDMLTLLPANRFPSTASSPKAREDVHKDKTVHRSITFAQHRGF